jgi:two-component system, NarL family, sensor histidine kinase UhpB
LRRTTTGSRQAQRRRYSPLFWRVLALNAGVLVAACVVTLLVVSPNHLSSFAAEEAVVLVAALALVAVANLVLLKGAFRPLELVTRSARRIDPNRPGQRVPLEGDTSEAGQLAEAINEMLGRLEAERQLSAQRSLQAQERERLRVAQELHDQVGQRLTGALLQLSRVVKQSPGDLRGDALEAQDAVRESLEDVRRIAVELRPEALDELGLWSALAALAERVSEQSGVRIRRRIDGSLPELSGEAELVIYRIAQEALTNVVRHAGAERAELILERRPAELILRVVDEGRGLGSGGGDGVGLRGMHERAAMVGGELEVGDRAEGGVEVRFAVPLAEESSWSH